jgi:beta-phosphoglucomutase
MEIRALVFDLDGVITDTAEQHYLGWQWLADQEGIPFSREANERLRGLSRRASIDMMLAEAGRSYPEDKIQEMMERKQCHFLDILAQMTPADVLPGVVELMKEARSAGLKVAVGSASRNTLPVIGRLQIRPLLDAIADGTMIEHNKPAPDLFLLASQMVSVEPAACVVIEDGDAGIQAGHAAGMRVIGLGPESRVGAADARFDGLAGVTLAVLHAVLEKRG